MSEGTFPEASQQRAVWHVRSTAGLGVHLTLAALRLASRGRPEPMHHTLPDGVLALHCYNAEWMPTPSRGTGELPPSFAGRQRTDGPPETAHETR